MSIEERKMLGRFLRQILFRFSRSLCKDAYEFLVTYKDRFNNYGLVETYDEDYTFLSWIW